MGMRPPMTIRAKWLKLGWILTLAARLPAGSPLRVQAADVLVRELMALRHDSPANEDELS